MKYIGRRGFMTGAAIAGGATALASEGSLAVTAATATFDAVKAGARANGRDDDHSALQSLFDKLQPGQMVSFPPGRYHLGKPLSLNVGQTVLVGFGAVFDNTVMLNARELRVLGLTVYGSPREGFRVARGQGGHFEALSAHENHGPGFLLGGADNQQVAWANFVGCLSLHNRNYGWHLDGTHKKNWINANIFTGCVARGNDGSGWFSKGHVNYNTWTGLEAEGNCKVSKNDPAVQLHGSENFLYGGHVKDTQHKGVAAILGRHSMVFGGRYVGSVQGAEFIQARVVNSRRFGGRGLRGQGNQDDDQAQ